MLKKNPGLFGAGKWNAPGGKLHPKETAENCAVREVYEETGLEVHDPRNIGTLIFFKHDKREDPDWIAHVFLTNEFHGTIKGAKRAFSDGFRLTGLPLTRCGRTTGTGTSTRSRGEGFVEISIFEEISRN